MAMDLAMDLAMDQPHSRYPKVDLDRRQLHRVSTEAFYWRALHPADPRVQCRVCRYPMDPAGRTVEHPDTHMSCTNYPANAPMETPLSTEGGAR